MKPVLSSKRRTVDEWVCSPFNALSGKKETTLHAKAEFVSPTKAGIADKKLRKKI
jgi:hypothetical protein